MHGDEIAFVFGDPFRFYIYYLDSNFNKILKYLNDIAAANFYFSRFSDFLDFQIF